LETPRERREKKEALASRFSLHIVQFNHLIDIYESRHKIVADGLKVAGENWIRGGGKERGEKSSVE